MIEVEKVKIKCGTVYPPSFFEVGGWKCPACSREWLEESQGGVSICHCGFDRRKKYERISGRIQE